MNEVKQNLLIAYILIEDEYSSQVVYDLKEVIKDFLRDNQSIVEDSKENFIIDILKNYNINIEAINYNDYAVTLVIKNL
jgi:hypothetical protein|uniref:Uncharacterized protein n=1 Tax=viral metagenome TaxID=1070528 RepID=A0A6C0AMP8_9ZZZZ